MEAKCDDENKREFKKWGSYKHDGVILSEFTRNVDEIQRSTIRADDVWVCSYPRSGTTLTQELVYLIQTLDFPKARSEILETRSPWVEIYHPDIPHFSNTKDLEKMSSPRVFKCHLHHFLLPAELKRGKGKIVYLFRNPNASVLSYYKLLQYIGSCQANTLYEFLTMFLNDEAYYTPWWLHVLQYWEHRHDENVLLIRYEELVQDKKGHIRKLADFLGRTLTEEEVDRIADHTDIKSMRGNDQVNWDHHEKLFKTDTTFGKFINKGSVDGWKQEVPRDIQSRMSDMIKDKLGHTDLKF